MQYEVCLFSLAFFMFNSFVQKGIYGLKLYQNPYVTAAVGGTVIMNCTASSETVGPFKWYKGGGQEKLLYSHGAPNESDPRIRTTSNNESNRATDLSITFVNITWGDAGVYYCVKFNSSKVHVAANGSGTQLHVIHAPYSTLTTAFNQSDSSQCGPSCTIIFGITSASLVVLFFLIILVIQQKKRRKGNNASQKRLAVTNREAKLEISEAEPKEGMNNDGITYASLQIQNGSSQKRKIQKQKGHEDGEKYASVHFAGASDEGNYADLSFNKSSKNAIIPEYYIDE
ncbi:signal-regulatory protein beta-2-like [Protopterus annectens]|uniref:signal-regulatory protein beta-2-like n=1 Tax=Protopterus annectens TaxID=7888 RepID=UPI001CFA58E3|nr:signal-regulatory protein beta-2-like [Protopterus annectens]